MEFVIVRFPSQRNVNVDGAPFGRTGVPLRVQRGTHLFDLDVPLDYAPLSITQQVKNTTMATPMFIDFSQAMTAAAGAPSAPAPASARAGAAPRAAGRAIVLPKISKPGKARKTGRTAGRNKKTNTPDASQAGTTGKLRKTERPRKRRQPKSTSTQKAIVRRASPSQRKRRTAR